MAVKAAERIGGRVIEVGVGTGLGLEHYNKRNRIVGVDLSRTDAGKGAGACGAGWA